MVEDALSQWQHSSQERHASRGGRRRPTLLTVSAATDRCCFVGLLAVLVWAPLPLASNRTWALALLAILSSALLVLALVARLTRRFGVDPAPASRSDETAMAWAPLLCLTAYGALVVLQLVPLPAGVRAVFGHTTAEPGPLSVDPFATRSYLLACIAYCSVFCMVVLLVRSTRRLRALMATVLLSGVAQAIVAVWLLSLHTPYHFLFTAFPLDGRATGTFANPNHLAAYLQLAIAMGLGLLLTSKQRRKRYGRAWRERVLRSLEFAMSREMLVRLAMVVMVIALVLTRSRGGNAAFVVALLLTGCWVAYRSRRLRRLALIVVASMVVVDLVVVGQWVGLDRVVERLEASTASLQAQAERNEGGMAPTEARADVPRREETLGERLTAARYALGMVQERPWLGFGGGTFHTAFAKFKGPVRLGQYDHAHNDYVEVAADTGVLGLLLLLAVPMAALWRAGKAVADRSGAHQQGAAVAVMMGVACMAMHCFVEFNMHVPAVALTFCAMLGMGWCCLRESKQ